MTVRRLLAAGCLVALAGCGAPAATVPSPSPAATAPVEAPAGAVGLADLGISGGPTRFWLPAGTRPRGRIDAQNLATLTLAPADGPRVAVWLADRLPGWGMAVTSHRGTSLVFSDATWDGAFTCSDIECALVLRRHP